MTLCSQFGRMDALAPLIQALHAEGRLRVWSLVITVFGDSVEPRGGRIATGRLRTLVERIGVEEGALRTALSRLAADGWVVSERIGRSSTYSLTARGRSEAQGATASIYRGPRGQSDDQWQVLVTGLPPQNAIPLGGDVWLARANEPSAGGDLAVAGKLAVGPKLADRIVSAEHRQAAERMRADLAALARITRPDPLDAIAARTLLIHRWRRMVLRFPEIDDALLASCHPLKSLRQDVGTAYHALSPFAESWLSQDVASSPAMPDADAQLPSRFRNLQS